MTTATVTGNKGKQQKGDDRQNRHPELLYTKIKACKTEKMWQIKSSQAM